MFDRLGLVVLVVLADRAAPAHLVSQTEMPEYAAYEVEHRFRGNPAGAWDEAG